MHGVYCNRPLCSTSLQNCSLDGFVGFGLSPNLDSPSLVRNIQDLLAVLLDLVQVNQKERSFNIRHHLADARSKMT